MGLTEERIREIAEGWHMYKSTSVDDIEGAIRDALREADSAPTPSELAANQCVHPKGIIGDDGGTPCCPVTMTPDASAPTAPAQEYAPIDSAEFSALQMWLTEHASWIRPPRPAGLAAWALRALRAQTLKPEPRTAGEAMFRFDAAPAQGLSGDFGRALGLVNKTTTTAPAPTLGETNTDNLAVDAFASAMKEKMADAHAKGRSGWECMNPSDLSRMLREHVEKGDPRDVANFCMMLWHHSARIAAPAQGEPVAPTWSTKDGVRCENCTGVLGLHRDQKWCPETNLTGTASQPAVAKEGMTEAAIECLRDVISHHDNIVEALTCMKRGASTKADREYWQHELHVNARMKAQAEYALLCAKEGMTDERIKQAATETCFARTEAGGWIFSPNTIGAFARALIGAKGE